MDVCLERVLRGEVPRDVFTARGHGNITASNTRTLEITKDPFVTRRGDCIVACCSEKAAGELDVVEALAAVGTVVIVIDAGIAWDAVVGLTPRRRPTSRWRIVARRSFYVDDSTVAVGIDKAASGLDRALVAALKGGAPVKITVGVCPGEVFK